MIPEIANSGFVRWLRSSRINATCPLCGRSGEHAPEVDAPQSVVSGGHVQYIRCAACNSLFTDPPVCLDYDFSGVANDDYLRQYLEVGAGLHAMIRRATSVEGVSRRNFLDVGCGYGFAVDLWRRMINPDAAGIELAGYGKIGAGRLGVSIFDRQLGAIYQLEGKRYGIVQAIEVIEHVLDTAAFLDDLDRMLDRGGVLVLSTPCADFVQPNYFPAEMVGLLSPGFHAFLFSRKALENVLQKRFPHVIVKVDRESLSAWASHEPIYLADGITERVYIGYLDELWTSCRPGEMLYDGIAYRLFKEKLNRGDHAGAKIAMLALEQNYQRKYGAGVLTPDEAISYGKITHIAEYRNLPYGMASYHFFRAIYARLVDNDVSRAAASFNAAAEIALAGGAVAPEFFQEALSFVWIARLQEALAWATLRQNRKATSVFEQILIAENEETLPIRPDAEIVRLAVQGLHDIGAA